MAFYDLRAKPGARILHPPGGAASNIFGIEEDEYHKQRRLTKNHMQSDIFAPADSSASSPSARRRPIDNTQTRLFGEPEALAQQQQPEVKNDDSETTEKKANNGRKGFNPITGQSYDESSSNGDQLVGNGDVTSQPLTATSSIQTRTRQPPGGVASKLW